MLQIALLDLELKEDSELSEIFQKQIIQEVRLTIVKPHRVTRLGEPLNDRDIDNIEEKVVENNQHNFTVGSSVQISKGQFSNLIGTITTTFLIKKKYKKKDFVNDKNILYYR